MDNRFLVRGKRKDNGEWVEGYYLSQNNVIISYFEKGEYDPDEDLTNCKCVVHRVLPKTVGGCTGLTDKNKKLMFEGDIIDHPCIKPINGKTIGKVFWDGIGWNIKGFYAAHYDDPGSAFSEGTDYMTVIGNIYDNSELLQDNEVVQSD